MASPPCVRSAWVWMLVVVVWLPGALEKCIFDEVQPSVRVVSATPTHQENFLPKTATAITNTKHRRSKSSEGTTQPSSAHPGPMESRQTGGRTKNRRELARSPYPPQPIRIQTWVPRESPVLSRPERERLEPAVREAVAVVSSFLSVDRVPGRLLLRRDINNYCKFIWRNASAANYKRCGRANDNYRSESCLDVIIPDDHLSGCAVHPEPDSPTRTVLRPEGAGLPNTDFLLYLHTQSTDKCRAESGVLAYAVHCQTDSRGRPLAGVVVICRDRLTGEGYSHQGTVQTVIHELFHALGFSRDLFATWRDCSYSPCSPRGHVTNQDGTGQVRVYTQSVVRALQDHLGSSDSELGGPLENLYAGAGGLSSHWEARVLQGSIMASALGDPSVVRVDPLTLAALQDTGWYSVNLSRAQSLVWGQGEGAMFGSIHTCHDNSSSFFCSGSGSGCHHLHLHKGACQTDQYLDGCRIYKPLRNGSECWKEENERQMETEGWSGEVHRLDSRCFFSNLSRENLSLPVSESVVGRCYRHRCTGLNRYQIQVSDSDWTECPAGGSIEVPGYQGLVFCPDRRLCQYPDVSPPNYIQTPISPAAPTSGPVTNESNSLPPHILTPDPSVTSAPPSVVRGSSGTEPSAPPSVVRGSSGTEPSALPSVVRGSSGTEPSAPPSVDRGSSGTEPSAPPSVDRGSSGTEPSAPPSVVRGSSGTEPSAPPSVVRGSSGTEPTVAAVLCVTAAASLLAAVMAAYRKYRSSRARVHAAPQAPSVVQLHSSQSLSKHC